VAPVKECDNCNELVAISVRQCPACGHLFPEPDRDSHGTEAAMGIIVSSMKHDPVWWAVDDIMYRVHQKADKPPTLRVTYFCGMHSFEEFVPIEDPRPFVRKHAVTWFWRRGMPCPATVAEAYQTGFTGRIQTPSKILVKPDGKYWKVIDIQLSENRTLVGAFK
jgi:DNA repair protein RadD